MSKEDRKNNLKSQELLNATLIEMEKLVDDKLKNAKTFTPILFTIVTSVIAYLFVTEIEIGTSFSKICMVVLGIFFVAFVLMIASFFGKVHYDATISPLVSEFAPHKFHTYCYLSDDDFIKCLEIYANRELTDNEMLTVNFLKQKINEYLFRWKRIVVALVIVEIGAVLLAAICFLYPFLKF